MGDLTTPDPAQFEFIPDVGYRYIGDGRSLILGMMSITQRDKSMSERMLSDFASAAQRL